MGVYKMLVLNCQKMLEINCHFLLESTCRLQKYIQEQEKADIIMDKLSVKEYEDPFRG